MSPGKVIPRPDDLNLAFFRKIVETGTLHVQRCSSCGHYSHPPRYYCSSCFSAEWELVPVSGNGTVHSFTVSHVTAEAAWKDELPYGTVVVELEEGPRLVGSAIVADPSDIRIGQQVRLVPVPRTDEFAYLTVVFDPQDAPAPDGPSSAEPSAPPVGDADGH
jgi:uncharacterized OB-fold protein